MKGFLLILCSVTIGFFSICESAWAARAYITDSFKVTLRTGPTSQNKILALLPSGKRIKVLNSKDNWSYVSVLMEKRGEEMEGWILSRYLITRLPWESQALSLQKENAGLKKKLATTEKERTEAANLANKVSKKLGQNTGALTQIQKDYESLKKGSAEYLELRATHEATVSALKTVQSTIQELTLENQELSSSRRNTWFVTGAMVLLLGLVIGLVLGRRQKKRKTMLYS